MKRTVKLRDRFEVFAKNYMGKTDPMYFEKSEEGRYANDDCRTLWYAFSKAANLNSDGDLRDTYVIAEHDENKLICFNTHPKPYRVRRDVSTVADSRAKKANGRKVFVFKLIQIHQATPDISKEEKHDHA